MSELRIYASIKHYDDELNIRYVKNETLEKRRKQWREYFQKEKFLGRKYFMKFCQELDFKNKTLYIVEDEDDLFIHSRQAFKDIPHITINHH